MYTHLLGSIDDCMKAVEQLKAPESLRFLREASQTISDCFRRGNKIILAGNGGSLCDAAHFAEELTGNFRQHRRALPAIVLNDPGHITCTANDMGFELVFARGIEAYGQVGDVFIGLSTSGNSPNLIHAFAQARRQGMVTISLLGRDGGALKDVADFELIIHHFATSDRIQEAHMAAMHLMVELIELTLFGNCLEALEKTSSQVTLEEVDSTLEQLTPS